jgi:hypothetical protein
MSSRLLDTRAPYARGEASEHPHRVVVLRLSLQGSVLVLVVALLLWGILTIGGQGVVTERHSLAVVRAPTPPIGCSVPQASKSGALPGGGGEGADSYYRCSAKQWPHTTTSRQPGRAAGERVHQGDI